MEKQKIIVKDYFDKVLNVGDRVIIVDLVGGRNSKRTVLTKGCVTQLKPQMISVLTDGETEPRTKIHYHLVKIKEL